MDRWVQYRVGDWLRYGEFNYGEKYAQGSALFPQYQPQSFKVFQWVTDRVEMVIRLTIPSWTHGPMLAGKPLSLPDGSRDTAFQKDIAARIMAPTKEGGDPLTVAETRALVKEASLDAYSPRSDSGRGDLVRRASGRKT